MSTLDYLLMLAAAIAVGEIGRRTAKKCHAQGEGAGLGDFCMLSSALVAIGGLLQNQGF